MLFRSNVTSVSHGVLQLAIRQAPDYLLRSILVTKIGPNEIKEYPKYRWMVPVQDAVLNVIREHIQRKFPKVTVYVLPKDTPQNADRKIDLMINCLIADETRDQVLCSGHWVYKDLKTENDTPFEFHVPFEKNINRYEGIIAAIEQIVFELSKHITEKLDLLFIHSENITVPETSFLSFSE